MIIKPIPTLITCPTFKGILTNPLPRLNKNKKSELDYIKKKCGDKTK